MRKLLLGTRNRGKQDELLALLSNLHLEILTPQQMGISIEIEETGATYAENARLKAVTYASHSGLWSLSDDSGLEVDALDGAPGLRSARLGGKGKSDPDRRRLLTEMLANSDFDPEKEQLEEFQSEELGELKEKGVLLMSDFSKKGDDEEK